MATNLALDDNLIKLAVEVGHHHSKKEAVTYALREYIQHHKQLEVLSLFGKIDYDPHYNYKKERSRK